MSYHLKSKSGAEFQFGGAPWTFVLNLAQVWPGG